MKKIENLKIHKTMNDVIIKKPTYILGLSGGPDSVYLLYYMLKNYPESIFIAAHLDHEWRKDSQEDVIFCEQLCKELNVKFITKKASELTIKIKPNGSQEEVGRKLRRSFFNKLAQEYNAQAIVLGHHADDQLETFFIRLIRGTTTYGLSCMKEHDGLYWRPLLNTKKKDILEWLTANKYTYLKDPTNDSNIYLRNKIRSNIIPAFKALDSRSEHNFSRTLTHIQTAEHFLQQHTKASYEQILNEKKELDLKQFFLLHTYLQKRILQYWLVDKKIIHTLTDSFLNEIIRFLKSPRGGSHQLNRNCKLVKKQNKVFFNLN